MSEHEHLKVAIREGRYEGGRGFVLYNPATGGVWTVFGLVQGGATREEAVFWAERLASKNGLDFERPEGWEDVVGALPDSPDEPGRRESNV